MDRNAARVTTLECFGWNCWNLSKKLTCFRFLLSLAYLLLRACSSSVSCVGKCMNPMLLSVCIRAGARFLRSPTTFASRRESSSLWWCSSRDSASSLMSRGFSTLDSAVAFSQIEMKAFLDHFQSVSPISLGTSTTILMRLMIETFLSSAQRLIFHSFSFPTIRLNSQYIGFIRLDPNQFAISRPKI